MTHLPDCLVRVFDLLACSERDDLLQGAMRWRPTVVADWGPAPSVVTVDDVSDG